MSKLTRIQMVVHLQSVDLFAYCTAEQMVRMASIARVRSFRAGECLYAISDPAESLFCLVEGSVELRSAERPDSPSTGKGSNGEGSDWRRVEPPGTFGAREILGDEPRRWSAVARSDGLALCFDADDLFDLLSNNIEIVKALFRQLLRSPTSSDDAAPALGSVAVPALAEAAEPGNEAAP